MNHFIRLAQLAAWASIAVITYFTLTQVGVVYSVYYSTVSDVTRE